MLSEQSKPWKTCYKTWGSSQEDTVHRIHEELGLEIDKDDDDDEDDDEEGEEEDQHAEGQQTQDEGQQKDTHKRS